MKKPLFIITSLVLFLPGMLNAASIRLAPVSIEILSNQKASSISIYNQSNETTDLQVRVFEWSQNEGKDQLTPTDDIAISPPFLKLQPNDSYNLRVVRINPTSVSGEKTYRIIIDELPKPADSRKVNQGFTVLQRTSLPLFVVNKKAITKLNWSIQEENNNTYLVINNVGDRHALLNNLTLNDVVLNKSYPIKVNTVNGYILTGKSKKFLISSDFKYDKNHKYTISLTINGKQAVL